MKKLKYLKILWNYIKDDKLKLTLYVILVAIESIPSLLSALAWGVAIEALIQLNFNKFLFYLAIYEGIYILVYAILQVSKEALYSYLEIKFIKNVSKDLYRKINNMPSKAFEEIGTGEFINRLSNDPDTIMELLVQTVHLICKMIVAFVVFIIAFKISLLLGLEFFLLALIMGFISKKFLPKIKQNQEAMKKESDNYIKTATENITGIREVKALGIKKHTEHKMFKALDKMYENASHVRRYERYYYALNDLTYFVIQFAIFLTCGKYYVDGVISLSMFMLLENCMWRIDDIAENISNFGVNFNKVIISLTRIDEILNNKLYKDEVFGNKIIEDAKGIVEFKNVYFRYREEEKNTLDCLNIKLEPNKKNAIVGRSGNGKSTIFNLLLRYFDATEGEILIDGININDLTEESLRKNISIIRQNPFVFNLSIFDNFKLVKENITLEEVREVCKKAYIDDYFMSLPNGYDTIIGEGGINLSGGQKQRLAIARTLVLNTKIILFDEATSALDNESQEYIKKTIDQLVKDHTIIIVAHRLSTIVDADNIYVIDGGKLAGVGKHEELLKKNKIYHNLYINEDK